MPIIKPNALRIYQSSLPPRFWKSEVLAVIRQAIAGGKPTYEFVFIHNHFLPEYVDAYQGLQQKIASLIPIEHQRPTFILHIRGANRPFNWRKHSRYSSDYPDCGMQGGQGPLADAHSLRQLIHMRRKKNISLDNLYIVWYSVPPPAMLEENVVNTAETTHHQLLFLSRIFSLLNIRCDSYIQLNHLTRINTPQLQQFLSDHSRYIDLAEKIAKRLKKKNITSVYLLDSYAAVKNHIYPKLLHSYGIKCVTPNEQRQQQLQAYIEQIKINRTYEVGSALTDFIEEELNQQHKVSHVLCASGEISIYLRTSRVSDGRTYLQTLQDRFAQSVKNPGIQFIDCREEKSHILNEELLKIEKRKGIRNQTALVLDRQQRTNPDKRHQAVLLAELIKRIEAGIEQYLYLGKFHSYAVTQREITLSQYLQNKLLYITSIGQLELLLHEYFNHASHDLHDWSLKARIIESLVGPQGERARQLWHNKICQNGLTELAKIISAQLQARYFLANHTLLAPVPLSTKVSHTWMSFIYLIKNNIVTRAIRDSYIMLVSWIIIPLLGMALANWYGVNILILMFCVFGATSLLLAVLRMYYRPSVAATSNHPWDKLTPAELQQANLPLTYRHGTTAHFARELKIRFKYLLKKIMQHQSYASNDPFMRQDEREKDSRVD